MKLSEKKRCEIFIVLYHLQNYNINHIYKDYIKWKKKENIEHNMTKINVLSDQSSIAFRVGHWHIQTISMTYQSVTHRKMGI